MIEHPNMLVSDKPPTLHDCIELYGCDYDAYMSDYPIWDESKRPWLNDRILNHFRYREIASETPAAALYYMRRTMLDMMASVNPMFKVLDSEFDILTGWEQEQTSDTSARQLYSATPQVQLSGTDNYATNLTDNTADAKATTTQTTGAADALARWATSVNNALYIVYNGLEPCFMQIFDIEGTW